MTEYGPPPITVLLENPCCFSAMQPGLPSHLAQLGSQAAKSQESRKEVAAKSQLGRKKVAETQLSHKIVAGKSQLSRKKVAAKSQVKKKKKKVRKVSL